MSSVTMRFAGISLSHNPKTLKLVKSKKLSYTKLIGGKSRLSGVNDDISEIRGTGEIYGENCFLSYDKLLRMSLRDESDILSIPDLGAFRAVLSDISIIAEPKSDFLSVSFEFRVVGSEREAAAIRPKRFYSAKGEESLWDVSYEFGTSVENLIKLNPHIRNIQSLNKGEKVRIY